MEENTNKEEGTNIDPEEDQPEEEKKFSQDEVNEIVKKRLQRERDKLEEEFNGKLDEVSAAADDDLIRRENAVACKEYLIDNNYPVELLDIVEAENVDEFQKKVTQLDGMLKPRVSLPRYVAPESIIPSEDNIREAFSPEIRHKPKKPRTENWY